MWVRDLKCVTTTFQAEEGDFPFIGDKLVIGRFCAIARGVTFIMNGANHRMSGISTYPFQIFGNGWEKVMPQAGDLPWKGDTVIGNDVWIGYDALIMPGVHIGNGAIVSTRSVVVSDVPPYAIVGGNPARVIRQRFDPASAGRLESLAWWGNCLGLTGSPFDSFLTLRGVRTLFARMRLHEENAHLVAETLSSHSAVLAVHYPGLATHPGHTVAAGQQDGFGGMVSFVVRGGAPAVEQLTSSLHCFTLAESLGGVESLVAHPATMTHASMDAEARRVAGIGEGLVRLSVGIEDGRELVSDLVHALDAVLDSADQTPFEPFAPQLTVSVD